MIGLGGAIGTGLFLGSGLAFALAGPAVIVAYAVAALAALALAYALAEMTVIHPEAGGFGAITRRYLGDGPSFVQRWIYWTAQVVNIGSEVVAAGLYIQFWFPDLPLWIPVVIFAVLMLAINAISVRFFGEFEFWFALVKVVTIVAFILLGLVAIAFGLPGREPTGLTNLFGGTGGFAPAGITGAWLALTVVTFSYLGTEAIAVTAAESKNPQRDIPRVARNMVIRLALFYVLAIAVIAAIVPWQPNPAEENVLTSPFVSLFAAAGVPAAGHIMNFVVLTAALSAMNTNLYVTSRMAHSLALDGFAPRWLGRVNSRGTPMPSLLLSAVGLALAVGVSFIAQDTAFPVLVSLALFCALITWLIIFATQLAFRRSRRTAGLPPSPIRLPGAPVTTVLAMIYLLAVIVTTAFTQQFDTAWKIGVPFLIILIAAYFVLRYIRRTIKS